MNKIYNLGHDKRELFATHPKQVSRSQAPSTFQLWPFTFIVLGRQAK